MLVQKVGDKTAIGLSVLCISHCLLFSSLVLAVPSVTWLAWLANVDEHSIHLLMLLTVVPTSVIALLFGVRRHKASQVAYLGAFGMLTLCSTGLLEHYLSHVFASGLTILGSGLLIFSHVINYRLSFNARKGSTHA